MNRRRFLTSASLGTLVLGMPNSSAGTARQQALRALAEPDLCGMLGRKLVRDLGVQYRNANPHECTVTDLCSLILSNTDTIHNDRSRLQTTLGVAVCDDFAVGRTVAVDGWILSITEARQCALFSMLSA